MADHILDNINELIKRKNIIRDPKFVDAWKEAFIAINMGKDPKELFEECKKQYKTDPDYDTYKLLAAAKILNEAPKGGSGRGGSRPGAGRKKGQKIKEDCELKKARSIRMTDEEYPLVLDFLKKLRADKKQ